jgi:hypothetical protein
MEVQLIESRPFPGWDKFLARLGTVRPEHALGWVQAFTKSIAAHNDGVFRGQSPIIPITLHVLLREWIRGLEAGVLPVIDATTCDNCNRVLLDGSLEINGLRDSHPAETMSSLLLPPSLKDEERLRSLWFHHLEQQGLTWAPKLELGRSQRMFAEIWPEMYTAGRVKLKSSEETAFLSARYALLLALGIWHAQGNVVDARELFKETALSEATLSNMLDAISVPLEKVQSIFLTAPRYPDSIQNYFQRYPIIRVSDWSVFAPLPDLVLQSWDLRNLFDNLDLTLANVGEKGGVEFYRALGLVFEAYARDLLEELARESTMSFIPEFRYNSSHDSPDGFLTTETTTYAFEMKCYRVPRAAYDKVEISSFEAWFASLLGTNDKGRPPLVQGASFFDAWASGHSEINEMLGPPPNDLRYFIVSYEDVPVFCSWNVFRKWYAAKHLDGATRPLWPQTTVISIRELEALVAAARGHRERTGKCFDLVSVIGKYHEYREQAPDVDRGPAPGFKDGLGNWILRNQTYARDSEPDVLAKARNRLFSEAIELGFPETL